MTTYIIVSLLSFLAGIFLYAKFGAVAISDFIKLEASLKAEITALKNHITTTVNTAKADADAQFKVDSKACASLAGNAKDLCTAEAKGRNEVAKADAEAAYENTPKAREAAPVSRRPCARLG